VRKPEDGNRKQIVRKKTGMRNQVGGKKEGVRKTEA
jgi:hypothetical protein